MKWLGKRRGGGQVIDAPLRTHTEAAMMLDDVYGSEDDEVPPQQESEPWIEEDSNLEWEETEIRTLARELSGPGRTADWLFN